MPNASLPPRRSLLIAAFAAIYIIWGSTYLAILIALETLPPFLMAGVRFLLAGALLFGWAKLKGGPQPTLRQWRNAAIIGGLLLLGGNGAVVWAEQRVPSGMAALLVTTEPLWVVLLAWQFQGKRPNRSVLVGLVLGVMGMILLVGPGQLSGVGKVDLLGALVIVGGAVAWAAGSLYASKADLPRSAVLTTGMQMLCGGAMQLTVGSLRGEWQHFDPAGVSLRSLGAFAYLLVFGSLVAFTAYSWLTRVAPPSQVSTYAYVNPVVAVLLGWALANEQFTWLTVVAAAVLVAAVALITRAGHQAPANAEPAESTS